MRPRLFAIAVAAILSTAGIASAQTICGTWNHVPTPNPNPLSSQFFGIAALSDIDVWAVGQYDSLAGTYTPLLRGITAHWDGSAWTLVPTPAVGPSGTTLTAVVAASSHDVWAMGWSSTYGTPQTLTQRWDGSGWSVVASPVITGGSSLEGATLLSSSDIWAVGNRGGGLPLPTVATLTTHWNGSSWSAVPSPNVGNRWNDLVAVSAVSASDVWAVGSWRNTGELYQNLALHWNGSAWSVVPTPNTAGAENELLGVVAIARDDVWATGRVNDGIVERSVFLHWNGATWTVVPGPGGPGSVTGAGSLVALGASDVWAVGNTVAHWDGDAWALAPNPAVAGDPGITLSGAARVGPCDIWAAGTSFDAAGMHTLVTRLTSGGGAVNLPPVAVAAATPASGLAPLTVQFSSVGTHDLDGAIRSYLWDFGDSSYGPERTEANPVHTYVQTGPLTYHASLQVVDDRGAAANSSVTVSIQNPVHVESQAVVRVSASGRWTGRDEIRVADALGSPIAGATVSASYQGPTSGSATGITNATGTVVLSTVATKTAATDWCFTVTGIDHPGSGYVPESNRVTTECESGAVDVPPGDRVSAFAIGAGPSPFREQATIRLALPVAGPVTLDVLDASGRLVRELVRAQLPAGIREIPWDGRDARGITAPTGLYFVRASLGDELRTAPLLRLR